jgi:hypothetical protein
MKGLNEGYPLLARIPAMQCQCTKGLNEDLPLLACLPANASVQKAYKKSIRMAGRHSSQYQCTKGLNENCPQLAGIPASASVRKGYMKSIHSHLAFQPMTVYDRVK